MEEDDMGDNRVYRLVEDKNWLIKFKNQTKP